jgi:NTE family protein
VLDILYLTKYISPHNKIISRHLPIEIITVLVTGAIGLFAYFLASIVTHNCVLLIDGGVLNPIPIAPIFRDGTDLTIAVNLGGAVVKYKPVLVAPKTLQINRTIHSKIKGFINSFNKEEGTQTSQDWGAYDIENQAFDTMQGTIVRQKLAAYPADIVIEIARNACGTLEFDRADKMIELGYQTAKKF